MSIFLMPGFIGKRAVWMLALVLIAHMAQADPENFVVDDFTFVRPPAWKWVWDERRSKLGNLLEIQGTSTNQSAVVYFWKFEKGEGSEANRLKAWQTYFHESPADLKIHSSTNKVAGFEVTFIQIEGTHVRPPHQPHAVQGAIIHEKDAHLVIRMSGACQLITDSQPAFQKMVENALREKSPE